jgi:hypothetical protein
VASSAEKISLSDLPPPAPPPPDADADDDAGQDEYDDAPPRSRSNSSRLFGVAGSLLRIHYEIAEREAQADQKRLVRGVVCFAIAFFLLLLTLLVAQALLVITLRELGVKLLWALVITAGADALFGLSFLLLGRRMLKAPVLPQTRALLRRTLSALLSP